MTRRLFIMVLAIMVLWAWPAQAAAGSKQNKTLKIVYVEWDCATASSNLAKAVLEDKLGYKVELLPVTQPILWTSIATGDADAMVTAWLPDTHAAMYGKVKNQVEMLGKLVGGARLGLDEGKEVLILLKAPWVGITQDEAVAQNADNQLPGIISHIERGAEQCEVLMALPDGQTLCATVPVNEATSLQQGQNVTAYFNADSVIIATLC